MNIAERAVIKTYEQNGWTWAKRGWPDFLLYRENPDKTFEIFAIEVKRPKDRVSKYQKKMHEILAKAGIRTEIVISNPAIPIPKIRKYRIYKKKTHLSNNIETELLLRKMAAGYNLPKTKVLPTFRGSRRIKNSSITGEV